MEYLKFDLKLSFFLTLMFILMTIVGTLTHELGHYSVAKLLGYEASINYQSTSHWDHDMDKYLHDTYKKHSSEIINNLEFPGKTEYFKTFKKYQRDSFWIILGGPLQTIITGTLGSIFLLIYRNEFITNDKVDIIGWTFIFLTLFWLRQVTNLLTALMTYLIKGQPSLRIDEMRLANHLDINIWSIQIFTGIIGLVILVLVIHLLPKKMVLTFLISGLAGGILGYYLWLIKFGQYIFP